jgi:hypothetical protein
MGALKRRLSAVFQRHRRLTYTINALFFPLLDDDETFFLRHLFYFTVSEHTWSPSCFTLGRGV